MQKKLNLKNKINEQFIKHGETVIQYRLGEITTEEYASKLTEILNITMPLEHILTHTHIHLAKKEVILINNLIKAYEVLNRFDKMKTLTDKMKTLAKCLEGYFKDTHFCQTHFLLYTFSSFIISNMYGNTGDLKKSDEIAHRLIKESFKIGDFWNIVNFAYTQAWNYREEIEQGNAKKLNHSQKKIYLKLIMRAHTLCDIIEYTHLKDLIESDIASL